MTRFTHRPNAEAKTERSIDPTTSAQKIKPYVENISEATAACLFTMVQGNVLLLGLSHWLVASQTGIVAGALATIALWFAKTTKPWVVSLVLGSFTAVVDFFVHPGMFGGVVAEAIVTGISAGLLSYLVGLAIAYGRSRRGAEVAS
ncbi:MAG: hypothetical protein COB20_07225 [SAR86 cluster bacterium]|uniref:Uncharacterized protein n=1 Tax=SAR86 cluster bacterium TaxID=2030880 RepID=A0A2A4X520_9GAMM|nr:MAG: hypothetical protein COB20_07225 [SAR86 cluster bacterium]